ncbi:hypothetical protein NQZ68_004539 [Dissostichus eleginoides]|nr:hypothetical protein NQZ68_004539 [Dissostichus eleginoides]
MSGVQHTLRPPTLWRVAQPSICAAFRCSVKVLAAALLDSDPGSVKCLTAAKSQPGQRLVWGKGGAAAYEDVAEVWLLSSVKPLGLPALSDLRMGRRGRARGEERH